jgi:hypothetical protein
MLVVRYTETGYKGTISGARFLVYLITVYAETILIGTVLPPKCKTKDYMGR